MDNCLKIQPYQYAVHYDQLDYDYAIKFFLNASSEASNSGCSSIRKGNQFGRNLDWVYNDQAEFIVTVPRIEKRYASIGIAGAIPGMTDDVAQQQTNDDIWKLVPFFMQDGINEHGVVVSTNVVPLDKGANKSVPSEEQTDEICGTMLVRFILDRFSSAEEAVTYIDKHVSVWFSATLQKLGYEQHYLIADEEKTYVLEFVNNKAVIIEAPYITNFYLDNVKLNADGTVYTPATLDAGSPVSDNNITEHGSGLERWNLIAKSYATEDLRSILNALMYTNAYTNNEWLTEFVGADLTCASPAEAFADIMAKAKELYINRNRKDSNTWQTVHSVVYDMPSRSLKVIAQENGNEIEVTYTILNGR